MFYVIVLKEGCKNDESIRGRFGVFFELCFFYVWEWCILDSY